MLCENLQFNLPVYLDDVLSETARAEVETHLAKCPVCRVKLADFQALKNSLRVLPRPALSNERLAALRNRIAQETEIKQGTFTFVSAEESWGEWLQKRLMPYAVGTAASLLFTVTLLWSLLSAAYLPEKSVGMARNETTVKLAVPSANSNPVDFNNLGDNAVLNPASFAATRYSVAGNSPSLNPQGALVALTKSIVRGKMKDDEVVVVADVFGNGLARIAEIVEPSSDVQAVHELEKALKNDPRYAAPFVPANMDGRSDTVRVIFKINRVDIQTHIKTKPGKSSL